jgi:hypothetical protein
MNSTTKRPRISKPSVDVRIYDALVSLYNKNYQKINKEYRLIQVRVSLRAIKGFS